MTTAMRFRDCHFLTDPDRSDRFVDPPDEDPADLARDPLEEVWVRSYGGRSAPPDMGKMVRFHDMAAEGSTARSPQRMLGRVYENGDVLLHSWPGAGGFRDDHPGLLHLSRAEIYAAQGAADPCGGYNLQSGSYRCQVNLRITDLPAFRAHFGKDVDAVSGEDLADAIIRSYAGDRDIGARLDGVGVAAAGQHLTVLIDATIFAPEIFHIRVAAAGRQSGLDRDWVPRDAGEAIFEAFWGANDSGSPCDMGLEIIDWHEVDRDPVPSGPSM